MKDDDIKNKFIELRAKNWSYNRIASELKVSKQTLISWSKELSHVIANLRAIEMETLQEKYFAVRQKRIELFGEALRKIQLELEKRELSKVSTEKLYLLLLKYADAVKSESSETMFSLLEDSTVEALLGNFKRTSTWRA
jgi:DNA-binding XRE family transcriptional regulator